jgi:hypothetical protein
MTKYAFAAPATDAPAHALEYAARVRPSLPVRHYDKAKDHDCEYAAGDYVDHGSDAAAKAAFEILALTPRVTKKEAQFALGFQLPKHVTTAADRYAKAQDGGLTNESAHRVVRPAPFRPVAVKDVTPKAAAPKAPAPKGSRPSKRAAKTAAA